MKRTTGITEGLQRYMEERGQTPERNAGTKRRATNQRGEESTEKNCGPRGHRGPAGQHNSEPEQAHM